MEEGRDGTSKLLRHAELYKAVHHAKADAELAGCESSAASVFATAYEDVKRADNRPVMRSVLFVVVALAAGFFIGTAMAQRGSNSLEYLLEHNAQLEAAVLRELAHFSRATLDAHATAGDELDPAAAPTASAVGSKVTLRFEFPYTELLGPLASLYWLSADGDFEIYYCDIANGWPTALEQHTTVGERWRIRDAHSGNHLLSISAENSATVTIAPSHEVTLELHWPTARSGVVSASDSPEMPLHLYRLPRAAAEIADSAALAQLLEQGTAALLGTIAPGGRLAVIESRPGDRFVLLRSDGIYICTEITASHELHQHANIHCGTQAPVIVRMELSLDPGVIQVGTNATLLRLSDLPAAWHMHSQLGPVSTVITQGGERWMVRDSDGHVLADWLATSEPYQEYHISL
ncbi:hypothetical protein T492DRAFT_1117930 [Pavlovales sp. CCMP2436]|nr:hypothetical protein T492DRAFT_1117930 [Pavlovales sp. CCMP2436]